MLFMGGGERCGALRCGALMWCQAFGIVLGRVGGVHIHGFIDVDVASVLFLSLLGRLSISHLTPRPLHHETKSPKRASVVQSLYRFNSDTIKTPTYQHLLY